MATDAQGAAAVPGGGPGSRYLVVARRYRPQDFSELIGQTQVAQALANAIQTHRVGHAYLFTGARGVGKTSTARILAKALNCVHGPTTSPCGQCDICQAVASGSDVDVIEIDGASNRGIDEIRQLRSNVSVRPSRARYKIYIIDEVHMLTTPAFNALLKTLEEPPEHVKFIFCTTEADKVPITVQSRCQRFDFAPIDTPSILQRLKQICAAEGVVAEDEALALIARRAAGSLRDSQSLLEQLLAFGGSQLRVQDVHALLGTANPARLGRLALAIARREAATALAELDAAVREGVDLGALAEQLLGYFRDCLVLAAGGSADLLLHVAPDDTESVRQLAGQLGIETLLAMAQILDHTLARLRQSTHVRTLVEIALVRLCKLDDLDRLPQLLARLEGSGTVSETTPTPRPPPPGGSSALEGQKKITNLAPLGSASSAGPQNGRHYSTKPFLEGNGSAREPSVGSNGAQKPPQGDAVAPSSAGAQPPATCLVQEPPDTSPAPAPLDTPSAASQPAEASGTTPSASPSPWEGQDVAQLWSQAIASLGDMTEGFARKAERVAISGPNRLVVSFRKAYTQALQYCERPEKRLKIEQTLSRLAGRPVRVEFVLLPDSGGNEEPGSKPPAPLTRRQQEQKALRNPLVRTALELFDGEVMYTLAPLTDERQEGEGT
jgi:DNA polymerase-3 subunit gamma/tau